MSPVIPGTRTATQIVAQGTYTPRTVTIAPTAIPVGVFNIGLEVDTSLMTDPAVTVQIFAEFSWDLGATWEEGLTTQFSGSATPIPLMRMGKALREPTNPNREVRGSVIITGGSFTGKADLVTYA